MQIAVLRVPLLLFLFRGPPTRPGPSDKVAHWREDPAIYVLQMFTFSKDTSKSACGALPAQQTLKAHCRDGWASPRFINVAAGPAAS